MASAVIAIIPDHLFSLVWHMRTHGSEPFEGIIEFHDMPIQRQPPQEEYIIEFMIRANERGELALGL